ncbi:hypothetical protein MHYP_G00307660 [Metynnis hypsauchen]
MKHHLGISKAKVHSHFQAVYDSEGSLHGFQAPLAESKELSSETKMMKKQIAALQAQLAGLKASEKPPPAQVMSKVSKSQEKKSKPKDASNNQLQPNAGKSDRQRPKLWYCFNCGEDGHIAFSCSNEPNSVLVNVKKGELRKKQRIWDVQNATDSFLNRKSVPIAGLMGTKDNKTCPMLSSWSKTLLEVKGANSLSVPYLGYIEVSITFPENFVKTKPEITTLTLVVPDTRSNNHLPLLIGTNTLGVLYNQYCEQEISSHNTSVYGYSHILKILKLRSKQKKSGNIGLVRLKNKQPEVIPAGQKRLIEGFMYVISVIASEWALLEHPSTTVMLGGIFVDSCLVTLPRHHPHKILVTMRNETDRDIILPTRCIIAELSVPQRVLMSSEKEGISSCAVQCCSTSSSQTDSTESEGLSFPFGSSPLPEKWKIRITEKLRTFADVFAQCDLDFGHATKVKHHIKLKDETPFKQRTRPIHPRDYEAVQEHLLTLLEAGIICESESPFSSPIVVVKKKNGDVRLCVDYRKLNLQTVRDAYALPNLEESFTALTGSRWFSMKDLKSGYYQIEMEEEDKPKTAFVTPLGFWEFNQMPQGVTNVPKDEQPPTKPSSNPRPRTRQSPISQSEDENSESEDDCPRFSDGNTVPAVEKRFTKVYHAPYNKNQDLNLPDEPNVPAESLTPESNCDEGTSTGKPVEENQAQRVSEIVDEAVEEEGVLTRPDGEVLSDDDVPLIDLSDLDGVDLAQAEEMPAGGSQSEGTNNNTTADELVYSGILRYTLKPLGGMPIVRTGGAIQEVPQMLLEGYTRFCSH